MKTRKKPRKMRARKSRAARIRRRRRQHAAAPRCRRSARRAGRALSIRATLKRPAICRRKAIKPGREQNPVLRRIKNSKTKTDATRKNSLDFASLDFPDRVMLYPFEIAERMGCCTRHIYDLILEGQLHAVDISRRATSTDRRTLRVPIESWREFLKERTT
jgi:hypothetical protein